MRPWARFLICGLAGIAAGAGAAVWNVRAGAWGSAARIGPWTTGTDYGTAEAGAYTRAVVALRGLLALPRREARYYNAAVDEAGRPLDGRCRYRVSGVEPGGSWWSLTLYDREGYLVQNEGGIYSVPSAAVAPTERDSWSVMVAPNLQPGHWLPTGNRRRFELTLRVYLPGDGGAGNLPRERLPHIDRLGCP
jgi:hypothetical protein